jgi:SAM-dependent methyltransferase
VISILGELEISLEISAETWSEILSLKYGVRPGWGPRLRAQFRYRTPDDWYEALLYEHISSETDWLDVGCGRFLFPSNHSAAEALAKRCHLLVGLDPSDNVDENPYVHQRIKSDLEAYHGAIRFDLITLRMVAEHITDPKRVTAALARLTKSGGLVVVYTIWKWSPVSLIAAATPMAVHHFAKRILWRTEERDTFPIAYKMNTRRTLSRLFSDEGFREDSFRYLDDCRSFQRWKFPNRLELTARKALNALGLPYPERCILAVYKKMQ